MLYIPVIINSLLFLAISGIHFYWAAGGTWFADSVLPVKNDGQETFKPTKFATIVVAIGLLIFVVITIGNLPIMNQ